MPTYDHGIAGLTGTIGVTIRNADGTSHDARTTAGITEPVAGSGIYHIAHPHPGTLLLFIFDGGVGTVGGSCFDDGLTTMPARAGDAMTLTAAYDAAKDDVLTPLATVDGKADTLLARNNPLTDVQTRMAVGLADADLDAKFVALSTDPLASPVPGDYTTGSAGYVIGRIQANTIEFVNPVAPGPVVTIYRGYDYKALIATALDFSADTWPDLTGATITFSVAGTSFSGSVVSAHAIRLELTQVQTEATYGRASQHLCRSRVGYGQALAA